MLSQRGNLVIVDPHTPTPTIYFGGAKVETVEGIKVDWDARAQRVTLIMDNTPLAAAMKAAGIRVKVAL